MEIYIRVSSGQRRPEYIFKLMSDSVSRQIFGEVLGWKGTSASFHQALLPILASNSIMFLFNSEICLFMMFGLSFLQCEILGLVVNSDWRSQPERVTWRNWSSSQPKERSGQHWEDLLTVQMLLFDITIWSTSFGTKCDFQHRDSFNL